MNNIKGLDYVLVLFLAVYVFKVKWLHHLQFLPPPAEECHVGFLPLTLFLKSACGSDEGGSWVKHCVTGRPCSLFKKCLGPHEGV